MVRIGRSTAAAPAASSARTSAALGSADADAVMGPQASPRPAACQYDSRRRAAGVLLALGVELGPAGVEAVDRLLRRVHGVPARRQLVGPGGDGRIVGRRLAGGERLLGGDDRRLHAV